MNPIIMTLVFSVVMLMFMAFPAIKIVEWISKRVVLSQQTQNIIIILITMLLSLIVGVFLQLH